MTAVPPLGSHYWTTTFGFETFEEFQSATNRFFDLGLPHIGAIDTPLQRLAWADPVSAVGSYLTAALIAAGYDDPSPSMPANVVVTNLFPLFQNNAQQEASMSGLVIPDCFQVTITGSAGGHVIDNVIGVRNASGTASGAAAAVKTAWEIASGPLAHLFNGYTMVNYHAVDIASLTGTVADLASTTAGGVGTGSFSTRGAAALIKWNGSNRSRSTRGRMYYGPLAEGDINSDGATVASTALGTINTAFTNFRSSLSSSGYPLVVLSRTTSTATDVTAHAVSSTIATQRRRIRS